MPRNISMVDALNEFVDNKIYGLNTAIPCKVELYNSDQKTVDVKPVLKPRIVSEDLEMELPVIKNVPVMFPQTSEFILSFPIKKEDYCLVIFSQRSISEWKSQGGMVSPILRTHHHLSDGFALFGVQPISQGMTAKADSLNIDFKGVFLEIDDSGNVNIGGSLVTKINLGLGGEPVLKGDAAVDAFSAHVHTGNLGAPTSPPSPDDIIAFSLSKSVKVFTE